MTQQDLLITRALEALHDSYVEAVNDAVGQDRMDLVDRLAAEFDREARALMGEPAQRAA
ncbi:hypothetical protein [Nocardioides marmoribigeumensis]|uniref:Uncharacterized protein n=1 Tax=Nocardioides marmoribigeumensis TaxID=433649 RepID=A0ABU2BQ82_9ACTN|nr:hypothetical protein [Nocardioides marmoribigeumensis]MDR7360802.1 hypothetical protein [Nocardioides marmoribigeumensis]